MDNPVRGLRLPSHRPGRDRRLRPGEEERLLAACDQVSPWLRPLVVLAIETAMRRGELLGLHRDHIRGRVAFLAKTKNGRARSVPLSTRALAAIGSLPAQSLTGLLFPLSPKTFEDQWRRVRRMAGADGLRFHDLRHEAVSRLFERGLGVTEVQAISGHRNLSSLSRYTHHEAERLAGLLG